MDYKKTIRLILGNKKLNIEQQLNAIKQSINAGEYKIAIKSHPVFSKVLYKTPFFNSLNDIYLKEPYSFTRNFKKEYRWITNIVENYFEQINSFLDYKNKFEIKIILGELDEAKIILNEVERLFGVSLWSIEASLIIEEQMHGSEANWNKLTFYLNEIKNSIYEFIINSSSKRIESKLSYDSFLNQFQNDIDTINADGIIEDFFVFKNFNIAKYDYKYQNLESILYVSNIFSVIDQYLILIDVILYNISKSTENDKLFLPFVSLAKNYISNDSRIINIYNVLNDKKELSSFDTNEDIFKSLNCYYSGNFNESLNISLKGLNDNPLEFEYYEIYCKSLINLDFEFLPTNISYFIDDILQNTYDLLTFKKGNEECWKRLLKISLLYMNTNLGKQVFAFLSEIEGIDKSNYIIGFLSATFNSHKNLTLLDRTSVNKNFGPLLQHHCFKIQNFKLGMDVQFEDEISTSLSQSIMLKAVRNYNQNKYKEAIILLTNNSSQFDTPYYFERKVSILYYSYLKLNLFKESLIIFGDMFFDDAILTRKLNYFELFEKIKHTFDKDVISDLIEYPILFSLYCKEFDLYETFDDFMTTQNVNSIQELNVDEFIQKFSLNKVIYFLKNVVTIDTLKYSSEYRSISDVEEVRINILNILISIDSTNKLIYEKEQNDIYRANSVRKVLKEVDEGRLYIDVSSLKEIQIKKFNEDFKRFKEIETSANNQVLIGFNTSNTKNWEKALTEKNEISEKYNSADYIAFKNIYLESRENFLFSKEYGLDSCLSTRIRHGALKNHIRSVFEKLNLVTSKFNNRYKDNEVWKNQLINYSSLNADVQSILKQFSTDIDEYTKFIVDSLIQIQTEKTVGKDDGLFKFFAFDEILFRYYTQNKKSFITTEEIIEMLLTNLVQHTLIDLYKEINEAFSIAIPNKFQSIIDEAIFKLREINLPTNDCQLIANLTMSGTEIRKELEAISDWFYLNTTSSSTLLSIETVIDASVELTNKINPNYKISPEINLKCQPFGVYSSLIFVFNILFNNVIKHSKVPFDKCNIKINIDSIEEKYFRIEIQNRTNKKIDYSKDIEKLKKIKDNWNDHSNIDRSNKEEESGFDKIKRILIYETYSKTDKFDFTFDKNQTTISLFFPYIKYYKDE